MRKTIFILILLVVCINFPAFSQQWKSANQIGGATNDYGSRITVDQAGNVYAIGEFQHSVICDTITLTGNSWNIYIAKYDPSGNIISATVLVSTADATSDLYCKGISVDNAGAIYITGNYLGSATFGGQLHKSKAVSEIFLAKYSSSGELIWIHTAGGTGAGSFNQNIAYALSQDPLGNCYITGRFETTAQFDSITISSNLLNALFIAKYDSSGGILWAKAADGTSQTTGLAIAATADGTTYVSGQFFGEIMMDGFTITGGDPEQKIFLIKIAPDGKTIWAKKVGTGGYYGAGKDLAVDKNGNAYLTGFYRSTIDLGAYHFTYNNPSISYATLIVKFDGDGNVVWANKTDGDNQSGSGNKIVADSKTNVYLTGTFRNSTSFGSSTLVKNGTSAGAYVAKLDSLGTFVWATDVGGKGGSGSNGIALGPDNDIHVIGEFYDTVSFASSLLYSSGGSDVFIATLTNPSSSVDRPEPKISQTNYYPNPADNLLHSTLSENMQLYDCLGKLVLQCNECNELSVANVASGIYYLNGKPVVITH